MDTTTHHSASGPEFVLYLLGKTRTWSIFHEVCQRLLEPVSGAGTTRLQARMLPQPGGCILISLQAWGSDPERCRGLLQTQLPHDRQMEIRSMELLHPQDYQKSGLLLIWANSPWTVWIEAGLAREEVEHCLSQIGRPVNPGDFGLSRREFEVLDALRRGRTYLQIADDHCVAIGTIKTQINSIYTKLGVNNKVDAIRKVFGSGWENIS